jgi:hypothetical protein
MSRSGTRRPPVRFRRPRRGVRSGRRSRSRMDRRDGCRCQREERSRCEGFHRRGRKRNSNSVPVGLRTVTSSLYRPGAGTTGISPSAMFAVVETDWGYTAGVDGSVASPKLQRAKHNVRNAGFLMGVRAGFPSPSRSETQDRSRRARAPRVRGSGSGSTGLPPDWLSRGAGSSSRAESGAVRQRSA